MSLQDKKRKGRPPLPRDENGNIIRKPKEEKEDQIAIKKIVLESKTKPDNSLIQKKSTSKLVPFVRENLKVSNRDTKKKEFALRASGISNCKRALIIKLLNDTKTEEDARTHLTLRLGTHIHTMIQSAIEKSGIGVSSELEIKWPEYGLVGHYDYVVNIPDEDGKDRNFLVEIKSCSLDVFNNILIRRKPLDKHIKQANVYCHILGLDDIIILYVNRNLELPQKYKAELAKYGREDVDDIFEEFHIKKDQEYIKSIEEDMKSLKESYEKKIIPEYEKISECKWCSVKKYCENLRQMDL